jgi:outer membrane protein
MVERAKKLLPLMRRMLIAGLCLAPCAGRAETLADAIALAYQSNPTLQSARAQLRSIDESYVQARAGLQPTAEAQIEPSYSDTHTPANAAFAGFGGSPVDQATNATTATLTLVQPLYSGGHTELAVSAASATIQAQREALRSVEAQVLQSVIQAYTDVRRDEQILSVYQNELGILQGELDDATARKQAGEVTRTDVEQSQTQLDSARAALSIAQGQLEVSRSEYVAAVGQNPGTLAPPPPLPGLPATVDEAFDAAQGDSAVLRKAELTERASEISIAEAKAAYRPTIQLTTTLGYDTAGSNGLTQFYAPGLDRTITVGALITVPLLIGGVGESDVRQAIENNNSDRINIETARRTVVQAVSVAWNSALANRAAVLSDQHAVEAARQYFADTQAEYRVGQRTTLDVLYAEQTLRAAQVSLAQVEHDSYLAEAALLSAIGRLEAGNIVKDIPLYDPVASFRRVRNAGSAPWADLVQAVDSVGAPGRGRVGPVPAPDLAPHPEMVGGADIPPDAQPSSSDPTAPLPLSTSPMTPPGLGADRGSSYAPNR